MSIEYHNILPNESRAYRMIRLESLKEFPEAFSANYEESVKSKNSGWKKILKLKCPKGL